MKTMTIGKKLTLSFAAQMVLLALLTCVLLSGFNMIKGRYDEAVGTRMKIQALASDIYADVWVMRASQRGRDLYTFAKNPKMIEASRQRDKEAKAHIRTTLATLKTLVTTTEGKQLVDDAAKEIAGIESVGTEVEKLNNEGKLEEGMQLAGQKLAPLFEGLSVKARRMVAITNELVQKGQQQTDGEASASRWWATAIVVLSLVVGGFVFYTIRQISSALRRLAADLAEGSNQVAGAAAQVSTSSQGLAQGASEQAASLEETSASTEEISSMTRKNADNSNDSAKLMASMAGEVEEGNRKLHEMVVSMSDINASSEKISKIIKTIDAIAFQTNILALNAAVEAARAGEAGMGFAVVADEVRNLAQRCAQAAQDTASLIEESVSKSHEGSRKLDEVAKAIVAITDQAEKTKALVDEVHVGSREQARGLEQISKAIAQMEQVTQKNAAGAEESAAAGEELNAQADTLRGMVNRLTVLVGTGDAGTSAPAAALTLKRPQAEVDAPSPRPRLNFASPKAAKRPSAAPSVRGMQEFPMEDNFKEF